MSAPTPAPGDDRPREGYYPDPSIPGYVRYWNGAAWVPGTSRPSPDGGEQLSSSADAQPAPLSTEETGPHFFDEDPPAAGPSPAEAQHGSRPEPATAWGADRSRQSGFGGDPDRRVRWGSPDPRVPSEPAPSAQPEGRSDHTDGTATFHPSDSEEDTGAPTPPASGGTVVFRRPKGPVRPTGAAGSSGTAGAAGAMGAGRAHVAGTPGGARAQNPGTDAAAAAGADGSAGSAGAGLPGVPGSREPLASEGTMAFRAMTPRAGQPRGAQPSTAQKSAAQGAAAQTPAGPAPGAAAQGAAQASVAASPAAPAAAQQSAAGVPPQSGAQAPMSAGLGGGQPSWAQQVHRLAGPDEEQPVVPWKPVREDPFQAAARSQSNARPAGLGKRFAARLVDTLVLAAVTGAAAVPLGTRALDHVNEKIDAAKLSGETVTVWLLDGTTALYLGAVLGVLIIFGVLYEALPTAKWGRTLGKKLCGLQVRDIEGGDPPSFGLALRRWLVYSVPGVLVIGVVGVVWGLFDRPWRQCWHDKAAHTFVAG
ncbi:RDD family protein [Streptomyces sp. NPDC060006]|uniref:RDD family protein n=1 Tax=unclassified Streptomyces TaxID=2593676 RepID=UPI00367CA0B5